MAALPVVRHACRLLWRAPGFSLFAILSVGVAVGAATAMFSLVHAVLLRAMPFADPDRLVWMYNARSERDRAPFSIADLEDYQRDGTSLDGLAAFTNWTANLTGAGDAERLEGTRVSGDFFQVLGTSATLGRVLAAEDAASDAKVAVLTSRLWKARFNGDPTLVGRPILLNGSAYEVVGVLPDTFVFPFRDAQVGDTVTKRQTIGRSGMTGLAGGDHLHFTMLVNGQPVNPVEWWDSHWIEDRVERKLREAGPAATQ